MKPLAIITARGGSKRIPKKNIREFLGKPIIAYSIEAALKSQLFDEIMVSTESEEIASVARKFGAKVPFMRSKKNADDFADTTDVLREVLEEYRKRGHHYDEYCCIYPTAPFVTDKKLKESYELLKRENVFNVVPMVAFSFPPQRGMVLRNHFMEPIDPESIDKRSQELEQVYHDCGQFYWGKVKELFQNPNILFNHTMPYFVSELEMQDIDNEDDWKLAEMKYKYMKDGDI